MGLCAIGCAVIASDVGPLSGGVFRVFLTLNRTDEGGRRRSISSGYRANCWIGKVSEKGERLYNDAHFYFDTVTNLEPGSATVACLRPAVISSWIEIEIGQTIDVCEGVRIVGKAVVTGSFSEDTD